MHTIHTFVLRLLVDSESPALLRGSLQPVPEEQAISFTDGQSLIGLLQRMNAEKISSDPGTEKAEIPPAGESVGPP